MYFYSEEFNYKINNIPVYNNEKTIYSSKYSFQNKNNTNFEIILIYDFSSYYSSKIIKYLIENDERIKKISNHKNMGSLYLTIIGVLMLKINIFLN